MLLFTLISTVVLVGTVMSLLEKFYDDIVNWLKVIGKVAKKVVQGVLIGCKTFINVGRATLKTLGKEISKNYSKVGDQWQVTEVERDVTADKIPDEIYQKSELENTDMLELTEDIEAQLLANYQ